MRDAHVRGKTGATRHAVRESGAATLPPEKHRRWKIAAMAAAILLFNAAWVAVLFVPDRFGHWW